MSEDASAEILEGTYRALCARGYADLTMQDIADRTGKSKAALHYHYDSKRALMLSFLDYLYAEFTERVGAPADAGADGDPKDAGTRLLAFVDRVLSPVADDPERRQGLQTAMLELKAQAPYDEAIQERLGRFDAYVVDQVRGLVVAGMEDGSVREVDPDDVARFVATALAGAHTTQVAVGRDVACTRRVLHAYVRGHLLADPDDRDRDREAVVE